MDKLWKRVKEVYAYDEAGELVLRTNNLITSTKTPRGYRQVYLEGVPYLLHRLIFFWHNGYFPKVVDHLDGDVTNNRIENLNPCNQEINIEKAKLFKTNTTGFKGVHFNKAAQKYEAYYWKKYKKFYCGLYDTAEEASKAREEKKKYANTP